MIIDNCWYGHRAIIANYCGFKDQHVFASIAHGQEIHIYLDRRYPPGRIKAPFLVWNKYEEINALRHGCEHVVAIGSPFLYLLSSYNLRASNVNAQDGTICFPVHGVPGFDVISDIIKWGNLIKDNFPPPYAVSIPFFDPQFHFKKCQYENLGFKVISFGKRNNPLFLLDFIDIVSKFKFATSDDMGSTAVLYSMALGLTVKHFSSRPLIEYAYLDKKRPSFLPEVISEAFHQSILDSNDAKTVSKEVLGFHCLLKPDDLADLVGLTSIKKRFLAKIFSLAIRCKYGFDVYSSPNDKKIQNINNNHLDLSSLFELLNKNVQP